MNPLKVAARVIKERGYLVAGFSAEVPAIGEELPHWAGAPVRVVVESETTHDDWKAQFRVAFKGTGRRDTVRKGRFFRCRLATPSVGGAV